MSLFLVLFCLEIRLQEKAAIVQINTSFPQHHLSPILMSRFTIPPMLPTADDDSAEASAVEDSLRGGRPNLFSRPLPARNTDTYAFAATPDSALPPSTLPAPWHSPRVAVRTASAAPSLDETPGAGPSTAAHAPPRIERQPTARMHAAPLPAFAPGAGSNLFTRPQTASTAGMGMSTLGSPTDMSSSFSFAPRGAGSLFALPARAAGPAFAAPHTPGRAARATTATTHVTTTAAHHSVPSGASASSTNLDAAALAAERRIREARAASRGAAAGEEYLQRRVSFSPTVSTPLNNAAAAAAAPPPPNRGAPSRHAGAESSIPHLHQPRFGSTALPDTGSFSTDSTFARPTATRLFATTEPQQPFTKASEPDPSEPSVSWSSTASTSALQPPPTVRLRKWDGSQVSVPAYIVSDAAETALEEHAFDYDVVARFDVRATVRHQHECVSGTSHSTTSKNDEEDVDSVQAILETQLGLRGLHGWYGHTFRTRPLRGSRKRPRASSPDTDPIVVYDAFGRVRGHITVPDYTALGGPPLPLPAPRESHALRTRAAAAHVLHATAHTAAREHALLDAITQLKRQWDTLQAGKGSTVRSERFIAELKGKRDALAQFQRGRRRRMLKGLQNAVVDSATGAPRRACAASRRSDDVFY
ncbi:conserved hypothetical protein [Sporisorium reilianum SRZ2]|uniref:Uncharacterized protein n=1 Tax=Sporisorium reilianum (strain SRZ2) TaxID=999809 RepID=E7A0C0_SPORE|nr:conserved hypothetical protein [Sporisorium reilianum SRZ2]